MAQNLASDFPIDPTTTSGTELADRLNRFFNAQNTGNSGGTEPPAVFAGMLWLDTSDPGYPDGRMKLRNAANTAWIDATKASSAIQPDGSRDFTAHQKLANVNPTDPLHAVPKGYADSQIDPLSHVYQMNGGRSNNGATFGIAGSAVRLVTPARDAARLVKGDFTLSINLATQGAGGRDQAANFVGQWCYVHVIWHPSNGLAAIASASSVAPTLPSGYTMSAFGYPFRVGTTANEMFACTYFGPDAIYQWGTSASLIAAQINGVATLTNWAAYVPPVGATLGHYEGSMSLPADADGNIDVNLTMYAAGDSLAALSHMSRLIGMAPGSTQIVWVAGSLRNTGNPVAAPSITLGTGTMGLTLNCVGYKIVAPY
jgi:hypothetical protein